MSLASVFLLLGGKKTSRCSQMGPGSYIIFQLAGKKHHTGLFRFSIQESCMPAGFNLSLGNVVVTCFFM